MAADRQQAICRLIHLTTSAAILRLLCVCCKSLAHKISTSAMGVEPSDPRIFPE